MHIFKSHKAAWAVSSQAIQDDLGAKSTNWPAG